MFLQLKYKRLTNTAKTPTYGTVGSTGLDVYADLTKPITLSKLEAALIPTGIAIELLGDTEFTDIQLRARSSYFKKGLMLVNGIGTIDQDYRGELLVAVMAFKDDVIIEPGEKIAQLVIGKAIKDFEIFEGKKLSKTERGRGGFGSTGK